jgi:glycosyltransferase involved in cell wall biosynthesis
MDILVVHPSLNASGGSERLCLAIIEGLKEKGYNVTLGTFEKTRWRNVEKIFGNALKPDFEIVKPRYFGYSAYGELLNFHRLLSKISQNYEVVIVSCTSPWFYCPTAKKAIIYMIPPVSYMNVLKRAYLTPYVFIQKMFLKKTKNKVILTNSSFSSRVIEAIYQLKCKVLYPPINIKDFNPSPKKEDLVVSIGRFDSFKKFELLIRAFTHVKDGKCIIMGSAYNSASIRYLMKLRQLINNMKLNHRVTLNVNVSFDILKNILSKAKIYVHCAILEHFGISVAEAMASGCVPIVHRSGGPYTDIIEFDKHGLSFVNIQELANNINLLLTNKGMYEILRLKAIERARIFNKEQFKKGILKYVNDIYDNGLI